MGLLDGVASAIGMNNASDFKTFTFMAGYFGSFYALWNWEDGAYFGSLAWGILYFVNTFLSFDGAVITHNTMHCPIFNHQYKQSNTIVKVLLTLTYGHPVTSYVPGHNLSHHKYTQLREDCMRTSKLQYSNNALNFLMFQPTVAMAVLKNDLRYVLLQSNTSPRFYEQCVKEVFVLFSVTAALLVLSPWKFVVLFYLPHFVAQYGIVTLNLLQHDGCAVPEVGHARAGNDFKEYNCSRNFTGRALNWLCFNNGYHTIHHRIPTMHWSVTADEHEKQIKPHMDPRLAEKNILSYMFKTFVLNSHQRLDFEGKPVVFGPESLGENVEWIRGPDGFDMKRIPNNLPALLMIMGRGVVLTMAKLVSGSLYSPNLKLL